MKNIILTAAIMAVGAGAASADVGAAGFDALARSVMTGGARAAVAVPEIPSPSFAGEKAPKTFADHEYDAAAGAALGAAAAKGNLGAFYGKCYEYVSYHMEAAGVIRPEQWEQLKIGPDFAYEFADWAVANPEAMRRELKLVKLPTPADKLAVPVGAIIVYERGACGFSKRAGHIEVVTKADWACSDGCESLDQACFEDPSVSARIHVLIPVK
ncbi:MAG: hypothetical protein A2X32_10445 [Elusimicrobia bacterium GWC2_64_44]|nr:MAG: hypothetical protein A2X32_10445 [Elusimicrobia bacterium GWC2_64_44]